MIMIIKAACTVAGSFLGASYGRGFGQAFYEGLKCVGSYAYKSHAAKAAKKKKK